MTNLSLNPAREVRLPVKPVLQDYSFDCGKAVVKTLMGSLGAELEDKKLQDILRTNRVSGTHPRNILEALKHLELEFEEKIGSTIADIEEKIAQGYYCLVVYQAWGSPEERAKLESGHYSLAYGYTDTALHLADPSAYQGARGLGSGMRILDKEKFNNEWKDQDYQGNIYDHWMVAVKGR